MTTIFPVLSPRGELSVALKQIWPGSFELRRRPHGFGVRFTHRALHGSVTLNVDDDLLTYEPESLVKDLTRTAWARFLTGDEQILCSEIASNA